jgi:thiosulfate dehydrogenase [quinone] large subunit
MAQARTEKTLQEPALYRRLVSDPRAGWIWLLPRLWLGWQWLQAGIHKLESPAWMQGGEALKGFWQSAVSIPETGRPPISYDWYRAFIQALLNGQTYTWFAKVVTFAELFVGVALILGLFTGFTALIGGFMNWNFMMAGSASVNPMFLVISIALALAWKVSGYIGLDYFMLRPFGRRAPLADGKAGHLSTSPQPAGD